jgi:hypothetical protein
MDLMLSTPSLDQYYRPPFDPGSSGLTSRIVTILYNARPQGALTGIPPAGPPL